MATVSNPIINRATAMQYTGTNGSEIPALFAPGNFIIVSDTGTVLTFTFLGAPWTVSATGWIIAYGGHITTTLDNPNFVEQFSLLSELVAPAAKVTAVGVKTINAILLGASLNVDVDLSRPLTSMTPHPYLTGGVGGLTITATTILTTSRVRVTVQAGLAYVGGGQVIVVSHGNEV